ncbi:MAG: hypothetical protein ACOCWI_03560, partial [Bacillota bacterium]
MSYLCKKWMPLFYIILFWLFSFLFFVTPVNAFTPSSVYVDEGFYGQIQLGPSYDIITYSYFGESNEIDIT